MFFARILQALACIGSTSCTPPLQFKQALARQPSVLGDNLLTGGALASGIPQLQLWGYASFIYEGAQPNVISIPAGRRVNIKLLGGNWTNPDGSLLADVVPGIGGEQGYVDINGVFHIDVRYVVQFVSDEKYAYVQLKGNGTAGQSNKVTMTVETDSAANLRFNNQILYSHGVFNGSYQNAVIWAIVDSFEF